MYFRLLGPVRINRTQHACDEERCDNWREHGGNLATTVPIGGSRNKAILSLLLINHGRLVSIDRLVDAVWNETSPPKTCRKQIQNATAAIRRILHEVPSNAWQIPAKNETTITSTSAGYTLHTNRKSVDALTFEDGIRQSLRERANKDDVVVRALRSALTLWTGTPFEGHSSIELRAEAARLEELRLLAIEELIRRELSTTEDPALHVAELLALTRRYPGREHLWSMLMDALHRCGRTAEALECFRRYRAHLLEEYGLRPGQAIRAKERQLLYETT